MNERIDFSSLDPKRDEQRWERMVNGVLKRAKASRKQRGTIWDQVILWTKPAIAMAAVALLCLAGIALTTQETDSDDAATRAEAALVVSSWAAGEALPETQNILAILGEYHVDD